MRLVKITYILIVLIITSMIGIKSIDYLYPDFNQGFLSDKNEIFQSYKYALYIHIIFSPVALLAGLLQFVKPNSKIHKEIGILYAVSVLIFAAPSGIVMSFFAYGGILSIINFLTLSSLWLWYTGKAYHSIKNGNVSRHRKYAIKSFILANSAISLRLLLFINNFFELLPFNKGYVLLSFLSWGFPLLIFIILNHSSNKKRIFSH